MTFLKFQAGKFGSIEGRQRMGQHWVDNMPRIIREIIEGQKPDIAPASMSIADATRLMRQEQIGALMTVAQEKPVGSPLPKPARNRQHLSLLR